MPLKKPTPLRLVAPPVKPRRTARECLNSIGWRMTHPADDADLFDVLDACRDPELTKKLAAIVHAKRKKDAAHSAEFDRLIAWLDGWNGEPETVGSIASDLIDAFDMQVDGETGAVCQTTRTADDVENVRAALLCCTDGYSRLRKALLVLWEDVDRVDRAFKYRSQKAYNARKRRRRNAG